MQEMESELKNHQFDNIREKSMERKLICIDIYRLTYEMK